MANNSGPPAPFDDSTPAPAPAAGAGTEPSRPDLPPSDSEKFGANDDDSLLRKVELPPSNLKDEMKDSFGPVKLLVMDRDDPLEMYRGKTAGGKVVALIFYIFPICQWVSEYKWEFLIGDVVAGLTIASLAVPQDLGYANLAKVPPINGLYSSFLPPAVYAIFGTSRHIAIGPTAVICLLIGSLCSAIIDPVAEPELYLQFVFTVTFFSGIVSLSMGILRLGFIIDYMSHAVVVGFMSGAAITIALQQLKGLLGYTSFTDETNIISVLEYIFTHLYLFNWRAFVIGITFLIFLLALKFTSKRLKKVKFWGKFFFFFNALGPLLCVIISTLCVFLTQSQTKVPCVKKMPQGLSGLSSTGELLLTGEWLGPAFGTGAVVALIGMTEAIAIARTFASMEGYHISGNKEMIAYGIMNLVSSVTSGVSTTGSFSRSAVNYNAGGKTAMTNIIMSIVVLVTLVALTQVFVYLPAAVLSSIIINAVLGLIDSEAWIHIFKTDKFDFLCLFGTFLGIIFDSIEIGLLVGVALSMLKVLVLVTRPPVLTVGEIDGTGLFGNTAQFKNAVTESGIVILRIDAPLLFTNANYVRERIARLAAGVVGKGEDRTTHVILDLAPVTDIDTTAIHALEETLTVLRRDEVQLGVANVSRVVLRKFNVSGFVDRLGLENIFLSVGEGKKVYSSARSNTSFIEVVKSGRNGSGKKGEV